MHICAYAALTSIDIWQWPRKAMIPWYSLLKTFEKQTWIINNNDIVEHLWTHVLLYRSVVHDGWNLWLASVNISWNMSCAKYHHCRAKPYIGAHRILLHFIWHAKATGSSLCLEDSTALFIYFAALCASSAGMRELQTINLVRRDASQPARMSAWHTSILPMAPAISWRFAQDNLSQ